jgi:hypothetical protein
MATFQYGNYAQSVGFNPGYGLLAGLHGGGSTAQQAAYGQAMAGAANMQLDQAGKNQELGQQQMQAESQQRQQNNSNMAQRAGNETQERIGQGELNSRKKTFNMGMNYGYAQMNKQRQVGHQQQLLNGLAGG